MTPFAADPNTWAPAGALPCGATIIRNPETGVLCAMPREGWPEPEKPLPLAMFGMKSDAFLRQSAPKLLEALDRLLACTIDADLAEGIGLTPEQHFAHDLALGAIAAARGMPHG